MVGSFRAGTLGLRRRSEFCATPGEGEFVTATKAARLLRSNPRNVKRLVADGILKGSVQWRGAREFCAVSRASIEAHLAGNPWLSPGEAANYLGVPTKLLTRRRGDWKLEIEKRGLVNFYRASALDAFLHKLARHERKLRSSDRSWADVRFHNRALDLVLAGKLPAFRDPSLGSGFRALAFPASALCRVASKLRSPPELRELIPARAAIERLAMNHNTLRELVAQGHLVGRFRGRSLGDIELGSIEEFEKKYSTAAAYGGLDWSCKQGRKLGAHVGGQRLEVLLDHPDAKPDRWGEWKTRPGPVDVLKLDLPPASKEPATLSWADTQDAKLEDQLTEIVVAFAVAAEAHYRQGEVNHHTWLVQRRVDNEAEVLRRRIEAERLAEERRLKAALERRERLFAQAKDWRTARDIRGFVDDVLNSENLQDLSLWASWARAEADALDPVLNGALAAADTAPERVE